MKTFYTINFVILSLLLATLWLVSKNNALISEYSLLETESSIAMQNHVKEVQSGNKQETINHLLAVLEKESKTSYSGAKLVESASSSFNNVFVMLIGLFVLQITLIIVFFVFNKQKGKTGSGEI